MNPQTGGALTMTAYAYCLKTTTVSTTAVNAPSNTDGTAVIACPTGQTIIGGGFKHAGQLASSYPVLNTWHTAFADGVIGPSPYTIYAVCASAGLTAAAISTGSSVVANNAIGTASATCAAGQLLTGGGYADANGAFSLTTALTLSATAFAAKILNLFIPPVAGGSGGVPPTPTPLQLTAYGICVTPA